MKSYKTKSSIKNKKIIIISAAIFATIFVVIVVLCGLYYERLRSAVKQESSGYLMEISKQMSVGVSKSIDDNFSALETIAVSMTGKNYATYGEMKEEADKLGSHWTFQNILVIDKDGNSMNAQGEIVRLSNGEYLREAIENKRPALATSEIIDGKDCFVFAVPFEITVQGITMRALAASYELSIFNQMLATSAFEGKGYAHIVDKNGSVIIRSESESAIPMGVNVLNSLREHSQFIDADYSKVKNDILSGTEGFAEIKYKNKDMTKSVRQYIAYNTIEKKLNVHDWRIMTFVSTKDVSARSDMMLVITLVFLGMTTLLFMLLLAGFNYATYHHNKKMEKIAYTDDVTGGNTFKLFCEAVPELLKVTSTPQYALVYTNLDKFKLLNEMFGTKNCDDILRSVYRSISDDLNQDEFIGRMYADIFCLMVKYEDQEEMWTRIKKWKMHYDEILSAQNYPSIMFNIRFGVYRINNPDLPLTHMIDRAKLALESNCTVRNNIKLGVYDDSVRKLLVREKELEDRMLSALVNGEFKLYLQPKYDTVTEQIAGAEALVRWDSATDGMIYPDEFIGLFERNGFITQLDLHMFERVCKMLKRQIDDGITPVKISVNCSRVQLKNPKFMEEYTEISDRYGLDRKYLEIEFTENVVFGDVEVFSNIINSVHQAGYGCSMDDFGSGFSSLSIIQDIPVDTLKLDKIFFKSRENDRTESVVASIISMAKALQMTTVAEGVEEKRQVEMLRKLGCDLIQGYYYAKPMPAQEFELKLYQAKLGKERNDA